MLSTRHRPQIERYEEIKSKSWKKSYREKPQTTSGRATRLSDNIGFKTRTTARDKKGHFIMIKGSKQQVDVTTINTRTSNNRNLKHRKQTLTKLKGKENATIP